MKGAVEGTERIERTMENARKNAWNECPDYTLDEKPVFWDAFELGHAAGLLVATQEAQRERIAACRELSNRVESDKGLNNPAWKSALRDEFREMFNEEL